MSHSAGSTSTRTLPSGLPWAAHARTLARRHPGWTALLGVLVFALVWLLELDHTALVPPVDNIEQLTWSRALAWGYYKHPPLPTFLMWVAVHVTGRNAWTSYLLGASTTLGAAALFWALLRELRGPRHANVALLAALCITFYNGRLNWYNHNTVLLVEVAASALFAWRAFDRRQLRWWVAIGIAMGLGALTKYQIAVAGVSLALFWFAQRGWRDTVHRTGALLALLIALVMFTPHLLWLPAHDFGPITYAMDTSLGVELSPVERSLHAFNWLLDAVCNRAAPALILLAAVAWVTGRRGASARSEGSESGRRRAARQLLVAWGLVPLVFVTAIGIVTGADLQMQWGTSFLLFLAPCCMEFAPAVRWDEVREGVLWGVFTAIQLLLLAINVATSPIGVRPDHQWRTFSAARLDALVVPEARRRLGGPIRAIVGPTGAAGALALLLPEKPAVLVDGRYDRSPWVSPELVSACGALELAHAQVRPAGFDPVGAPFAHLFWRVLLPSGHPAGCASADAAP